MSSTGALPTNTAPLVLRVDNDNPLSINNTFVLNKYGKPVPTGTILLTGSNGAIRADTSISSFNVSSLTTSEIFTSSIQAHGVDITVDSQTLLITQSQTFVIPNGTTSIDFEIIGAAGSSVNNNDQNSGIGGNGAYISGSIDILNNGLVGKTLLLSPGICENGSNNSSSASFISITDVAVNVLLVVAAAGGNGGKSSVTAVYQAEGGGGGGGIFNPFGDSINAGQVALGLSGTTQVGQNIITPGSGGQNPPSSSPYTAPGGVSGQGNGSGATNGDPGLYQQLTSVSGGLGGAIDIYYGGSGGGGYSGGGGGNINSNKTIVSGGGGGSSYYSDEYITLKQSYSGNELLSGIMPAFGRANNKQTYNISNGAIILHINKSPALTTTGDIDCGGNIQCNILKYNILDPPLYVKPNEAWSNFPAEGNVDISNYTLNNIRSLNVSTIFNYNGIQISESQASNVARPSLSAQLADYEIRAICDNQTGAQDGAGFLQLTAGGIPAVMSYIQLSASTTNNSASTIDMNQNIVLGTSGEEQVRINNNGINIKNGLIVTSGGANITGALSATSGTFSGALSATSGTFSGALSATSGTFSDTLSANNGLTVTSGALTANNGLTVTSGGANISGVITANDGLSITDGDLNINITSPQPNTENSTSDSSIEVSYNIITGNESIVFEIVGAGGSGQYGDSSPGNATGAEPGWGAYIQGKIINTQVNDIIKVVQGNVNSSGSGASYVYLIRNTTNILLAVAGAGGGNGWATVTNSAGGHGGGGSGNVINGNSGGFINSIANAIGGTNGNGGGYAGSGGSSIVGNGGAPDGNNGTQFSGIIPGSGGLGGQTNTKSGGSGGGGYYGGGGGGSGTFTSGGGGGGSSYINFNYVTNVISYSGSYLINNTSPLNPKGTPRNNGMGKINIIPDNTTISSNGDIRCNTLYYSSLYPPISITGGGNINTWSNYNAISDIDCNNNNIINADNIECNLINGSTIPNIVIIYNNQSLYTLPNTISSSMYNLEITAIGGGGGGGGGGFYNAGSVNPGPAGGGGGSGFILTQNINILGNTILNITIGDGGSGGGGSSNGTNGTDTIISFNNTTITANGGGGGWGPSDGYDAGGGGNGGLRISSSSNGVSYGGGGGGGLYGSSGGSVGGGPGGKGEGGLYINNTNNIISYNNGANGPVDGGVNGGKGGGYNSGNGGIGDPSNDGTSGGGGGGGGNGGGKGGDYNSNGNNALQFNQGGSGGAGGGGGGGNNKSGGDGAKGIVIIKYFKIN